jgi:N-acetylglucosamine kinase
MKSARLFLGVDGGQSSTTALIGAEDGSILGMGGGGPCNHAGASEGPAKLKRTVLECVGQACEKAGLDRETVTFEAACFGMSGGPADKRALLSEVLPSGKLIVTDDAVIALSGAFGGGSGVVTIAGTGSISFARREDGRTARAGGWGYIFGDEGGAFDIVRQALRAALRHEEGWGGPAQLHGALLARCGAATANDLLHRFYTTEWPRSRVAALAPVVDELASAGDFIAQSILRDAARQLAAFALAAKTTLWETGSPARFSFIGGVFQSTTLLSEFRSSIELHSGCMVVPPLLGAAHGALLEAYRAAGVSPDPAKLLTSNF